MSQAQVRTNEKLIAPLLVKHAAPSVGKSYRFIPTGQIVKSLEDVGFQVVDQQYTQRAGKLSPYSAHMIALEHPRMPKHQDVKPRIYLRASHNGRTPLSVMAGWLRMVCSNGLVVGDVVSSFKIYHRGNNAVLENVEARVKEAVASFDILNEKRERLLKVSMTQKEQLDFAKAALDLRYPDSGSMYEPAELLRVEREQDAGDSAWHVYNRVQEHLSKGGLEGRTSNSRTIRMLPLTSVWATVSVNRGLWAMINDIAERH